MSIYCWKKPWRSSSSLELSLGSDAELLMVMDLRSLNYSLGVDVELSMFKRNLGLTLIAFFAETVIRDLRIDAEG